MTFTKNLESEKLLFEKLKTDLENQKENLEETLSTIEDTVESYNRLLRQEYYKQDKEEDNNFFDIDPFLFLNEEEEEKGSDDSMESIPPQFRPPVMEDEDTRLVEFLHINISRGYSLADNSNLRKDGCFTNLGDKIVTEDNLCNIIYPLN